MYRYAANGPLAQDTSDERIMLVSCNFFPYLHSKTAIPSLLYCLLQTWLYSYCITTFK